MSELRHDSRSRLLAAACALPGERPSFKRFMCPQAKARNQILQGDTFMNSEGLAIRRQPDLLNSQRHFLRGVRRVPA